MVIRAKARISRKLRGSSADAGGSKADAPEIPVDDAVARFQDGWGALKHSLRNTTDEMLERECEGHPWKRGDRAVGALLNEVSHHGTQICVLRDLYAHR